LTAVKSENPGETFQEEQSMYRHTYQSAILACGLAVGVLTCLAGLGFPTASAQPPAKQEVAGNPAKVALPTGVKVPSQVRGIVTEVLVKEGQRVKKGGVLLRLDDRLARLQERIALLKVRKAEAEVEFGKAQAGAMKSQYDRVLAQFKLRPDSVSPEEMSMKKFAWDQATYETEARKVAVQTAETELQIVHLQIDQYVIRAPAAGIVQRIHVHPGEAVHRELDTVIEIRVSSGEQ
jgi:multidrug resistance efflux pump